jgi:hypothetical protein
VTQTPRAMEEAVNEPDLSRILGDEHPLIWIDWQLFIITHDLILRQCGNYVDLWHRSCASVSESHEETTDVKRWFVFDEIIESSDEESQWEN